MKMNISTESVNSVTSSANEEDNKLEFQIRPPTEKKFNKNQTNEIVHAVLVEELSNKQYKVDDLENVSKSLAAILKKRLRATVDADYKLIAHVTLGEQRGAGIRSVARCLWDSATDAAVTTPFENEFLFCVATIFAVYSY